GREGVCVEWNEGGFAGWQRRASGEQQRMPIAIPRQPLDVEPSVVRRTPCRRRQLRFMPDKPVAETRHIFAAQTMVRINRHAQQPVRWDTGWLFLQTFQPLLETERRRDKHELAPVLLGERHSLKVVNGTIRQTLQWPPDQTSLLLPIGGQVEFVKRVGDMIVAEQKARVGERDHTRGVVSVIT